MSGSKHEPLSWLGPHNGAQLSCGHVLATTNGARLATSTTLWFALWLQVGVAGVTIERLEHLWTGEP